MTRDKFIKYTARSYKCAARFPEEYCDACPKDDYTVDDQAELYRMIERRKVCHHGRSMGGGCYTSKRGVDETGNR